ncbi:sensor histidine kinase [Lacisediminimonas profundi]|uniref:sensor histidine kinase n=1 Tax=Lacisediminimonas profundi TaxID=2603856 RepID=UPI001F4F2605|nr:sensor histidine kinase [Lacisediminimonas profundi]
MTNFLANTSFSWRDALPGLLFAASCFSTAFALLGFSGSRLGPCKRRLLVASALAVLLVGLGVLAMLPIGSGPGPQSLGLALVLALAALLVSVALWPLAWRARSEPQRALQQLRDAVRQLEHEVVERKRAEQELQKSRELLRQLSAYQEQVKEDERKRIAREIHDDLGQSLMALRIDISMLEARTAHSHPLLNQKAGQVLRHIDAAIKSVRSIINNLRPSVLDLGLHAALEWQVGQFQRRTGISCELSMEGPDPSGDLDDQLATALFRVLQESLTNVARHAQASMVSITVRPEGERVVMTVADNGVGIFPGCRRKPNSFGLLGIGERISSLGGSFTVDSVPGEGTVLTVSVPIHSPVASAHMPLAG